MTSKANTVTERHEFITGYIDAMVWAEALSEGDEFEYEPLDLPVELARPLLSFNAVKSLVRDAMEFFTAEQDDLREAIGCGREWGDMGHDYALTRNGEGAGFWDRGMGAVGDRLTKAAKVYGESTLVLVGDSGTIEVL